MRIKDLEIKGDNPFKNCKLGREPHADVLTSIIEAHSSGFVLAVDGR